MVCPLDICIPMIYLVYCTSMSCHGILKCSPEQHIRHNLWHTLHSHGLLAFASCGSPQSRR